MTKHASNKPVYDKALGIKLDDYEAMSAVRDCFSDIQIAAERISNLLGQLQGRFDPDEVRDYLQIISCFAENMSQTVTSFFDDLMEGRKANLMFRYPTEVTNMFIK